MRFKAYEVLLTLIACMCIVYACKPTVHEYSIGTHTTADVEVGDTYTVSAWDRAYAAIRDKDGAVHVSAYMDAIEVNIRPDLYDTLAPVVAAIRYAENGGEGREYGILHPRVDPTYRSQAGWCAATVQKHWDRYITAGGDPTDVYAYIEDLSYRYCPIGASNDPTGLNQHWLGNVTHHYNIITL
jgi:hypothetical protein